MAAVGQTVVEELGDAKTTVDAALKDAAQAGYISSGDFGYFAPSEAKSAVRGITAGDNPCL